MSDGVKFFLSLLVGFSMIFWSGFKLGLALEEESYKSAVKIRPELEQIGFDSWKWLSDEEKAVLLSEGLPE